MAHSCPHRRRGCARAAQSARQGVCAPSPGRRRSARRDRLACGGVARRRADVRFVMKAVQAHGSARVASRALLEHTRSGTTAWFARRRPVEAHRAPGSSRASLDPAVQGGSAAVRRRRTSQTTRILRGRGYAAQTTPLQLLPSLATPQRGVRRALRLGRGCGGRRPRTRPVARTRVQHAACMAGYACTTLTVRGTREWPSRRPVAPSAKRRTTRKSGEAHDARLRSPSERWKPAGLPIVGLYQSTARVRGVRHAPTAPPQLYRSGRGQFRETTLVCIRPWPLAYSRYRGLL